MRVLITGGAGFIGSNIAKYLISKNIKVRVIDNLSSGKKTNLDNLNVDFIEGDILDRKLLDSLMEDIDLVYHLAASVGRLKGIENPIEDAQANIIGTINILESMKKYSVKKIIYSSSAAVYGEPKKELIDEKHETNPNSQYGVSKLAAEKLVEAYKHLYNIDFVILRYFNIFGINQRYDYYGNVIPIFVNKILNNLPIKIYGDGLQTRDFINVFDIAKINYLAAINNKVSNRIINVGTDQEISIISLASKIYSILKKDKDIIYSESRIGDVRNCRANNFNLREKLGVNKFVDFDFGLREYIDWYIREEFPK